MQFSFQVIEATFEARPNRFLVLARLSTGELVRAHCADPGRLRELLAPGAALYLSPSTPTNSRVTNSRITNRRTQYDLRFVIHPETGVLVSLDTRLPNALFAEEVVAGRLPPFGRVQWMQREVAAPVGLLVEGRVRSRFDFLLCDEWGRQCWVEVKSVTLVEDGRAEFPDAPTVRGRRHLEELAQIARRNQERTAVVFMVQRPDAEVLHPRWQTDPAFGVALASAQAAGVELYAYTCSLLVDGIHISRAIPVELSR
jgi:sugar fermentation stimulation protein A